MRSIHSFQMNPNVEWGGEYLCSFQPHMTWWSHCKFSRSHERRGCSHYEGLRAAWTRMQPEQAWKGSSSIKWKHAFCQLHATHLCNPWISRGAQPSQGLWLWGSRSTKQLHEGRSARLILYQSTGVRPRGTTWPQLLQDPHWDPRLMEGTG